MTSMATNCASSRTCSCPRSSWRARSVSAPAFAASRKGNTLFQRVCDSPASDPERVAKLKRLQQQLDPFELSRTIQAKLEHIFQLSQETAAVEKAASHPPLPQVSTDIHRKKKEAKKKEEKRRRRVTSYVAGTL